MYVEKKAQNRPIQQKPNVPANPNKTCKNQTPLQLPIHRNSGPSQNKNNQISMPPKSNNNALAPDDAKSGFKASFNLNLKLNFDVQMDTLRVRDIFDGFLGPALIFNRQNLESKENSKVTRTCRESSGRKSRRSWLATECKRSSPILSTSN